MNEHAHLSRSYGLWVIIAWSFVIVAEIAARVWLLVNIPGLMTLPARNWIVPFIILDMLFIIGFGLAAYGLARRLEWGRRLFIGLSIARFGLLIVGLFLPNAIFPQANQGLLDQQWWLVARYTASIVLPVWYLSLPHVRARFRPRLEMESEIRD